MFGHTRTLQLLRGAISTSTLNPETFSHLFPKTLNPNFENPKFQWLIRKLSTATSSAGGVWRNPNSISIWRRKKEIGKEGLIVAKELKRLQSNHIRLQRFIQSNVSRLLKSDLVSVLAEFQRQDQVFLSMKVSTSSSVK